MHSTPDTSNGSDPLSAQGTPGRHALQIRYVPPADLHPHPRNAGAHSERHIEQIAGSIRLFGLYGSS